MGGHAIALLLTSSRFLLGPAFWFSLPAALHDGGDGGVRAALPLGLALAAAASDFADGRVARGLGAATPRGAALDVAADAAFVLPALAGLARAGIVSALLPCAAALALAALAARWSSSPPRAAAPRRSPTDRLGHLAGILNYGAVLAGAAVAAGIADAGSVAGASLGLAALNLAPLALRAVAAGTGR